MVNSADLPPDALPENRDELVQHLEKLTGRTLRTREDIQAYVKEVTAPQGRGWTFGAALAQAEESDAGRAARVMLEIVSMRSITFFVPARMPVLKSSLEALG